MDKINKIVSKRWEKETDFSKTWFCFPPTQYYLRECITSNGNIFEYHRDSSISARYPRSRFSLSHRRMLDAGG